MVISVAFSYRHAVITQTTRYLFMLVNVILLNLVLSGFSHATRNRIGFGALIAFFSTSSHYFTDLSAYFPGYVDKVTLSNTPLLWRLLPWLNDSTMSLVVLGGIGTVVWVFCLNTLPQMVVPFCVILLYSSSVITSCVEIYLAPIHANIILVNGLLLIHPILVYLGYGLWFFVGIHAVRMQARIRSSAEWTRFSAQAANLMYYALTTCGLALAYGCWWAQQELNWGGWWNWDAIELVALVLSLGSAVIVHYCRVSNVIHVLRLARAGWYQLGVVYLLSRFDIVNSIHTFTVTATRALYTDWIVISLVILVVRAISVLQPVLNTYTSFYGDSQVRVLHLLLSLVWVYIYIVIGLNMLLGPTETFVFRNLKLVWLVALCASAEARLGITIQHSIRIIRYYSSRGHILFSGAIGTFVWLPYWVFNAEIIFILWFVYEVLGSVNRHSWPRRLKYSHIFLLLVGSMLSLLGSADILAILAESRSTQSVDKPSVYSVSTGIVFEGLELFRFAQRDYHTYFVKNPLLVQPYTMFSQFFNQNLAASYGWNLASVPSPFGVQIIQPVLVAMFAGVVVGLIHIRASLCNRLYKSGIV